MMHLVLSLFPGAGLLDRGFERAGFCVVRGPDTLLGQDVRTFTVPAGLITGVIGGPPCQDFSRARRHPPTGYGLQMLAEFRRLITEAQPAWWLMENVPGVPDMLVDRYVTQRFNILASEFRLAQRRNRSFQFGSSDGLKLIIPRVTQSHRTKPAPLASDGDRGRRRSFAEVCELQGLPRTFTLPGLSRRAMFRAVGNGVPVPVAEAIARAITLRGRVPGVPCPCDCGRVLTGRQLSATPACRKRLERSRRGQSHVPSSVTLAPTP